MTTIPVEFEDAKAEALRAVAARRKISVEELVRIETEKVLPHSAFSGSEKLNMDLKQLWASLPPGFTPPTDEEIEQLKHERRMKKALL